MPYFSGMDTEDIENNLNNFEVDIKNLLNLILDGMVLNQAMIRGMMDNQLLIMKMINPEADIEEIADENYVRILTYVTEIQALVSKKF